MKKIYLIIIGILLVVIIIAALYFFVLKPKTIIGRYVRLERNGIAEHLNITEMKIYNKEDRLFNIESTNILVEPNLNETRFPIDNLIDGRLINFVITSNVPNAFIQIDLNTDVIINRVVIYNRIDNDVTAARIDKARLVIVKSNGKIAYTSDEIIGGKRDYTFNMPKKTFTFTKI